MSPSTTSTWLLNASRDGDPTASLGSLFQCLITLSVKKFFLISSLNLPWRNLRQFPLTLSLVTCKKGPTTAPFLRHAGLRSGGAAAPLYSSPSPAALPAPAREGLPVSRAKWSLTAGVCSGPQGWQGTPWPRGRQRMCFHSPASLLNYRKSDIRKACVLFPACTPQRLHPGWGNPKTCPDLLPLTCRLPGLQKEQTARCGSCSPSAAPGREEPALQPR